MALAGRSAGRGCRSSACRWRYWRRRRSWPPCRLLPPASWPLARRPGRRRRRPAVALVGARRSGNRWFALASLAAEPCCSAAPRLACAGPRASGRRARSPPARSGSAAGWATPPVPPPSAPGGWSATAGAASSSARRRRPGSCRAPADRGRGGPRGRAGRGASWCIEPDSETGAPQLPARRPREPKGAPSRPTSRPLQPRSARGDHAAAARAQAAPAPEPLPPPLDTGFELPGLDLLAQVRAMAGPGKSPQALAETSRQLETVLDDFGVRGEIIDAKTGPVVTLYELEPAPGTRAARVISLADDIARSLCALSVRVAVVPGRNVIGIELPERAPRHGLSARAARGRRLHAPAAPACRSPWARTSRGTADHRRSRPHAASPDRRHHRLGQVGGDQRHDPVAALPAHAGAAAG